MHQIERVRGVAQRCHQTLEALSGRCAVSKGGCRDKECRRSAVGHERRQDDDPIRPCEVEVQQQHARGGETGARQQGQPNAFGP